MTTLSLAQRFFDLANDRLDRETDPTEASAPNCLIEAILHAAQAERSWWPPSRHKARAIGQAARELLLTRYCETHAKDADVLIGAIREMSQITNSWWPSHRQQAEALKFVAREMLLARCHAA